MSTTEPASSAPISATDNVDPLSFAEREQNIRHWIANKESVCPYAPGLARFVHLPKMTGISMDNVRYLSNELKAFYKDKQENERTGRWILLPHQEWANHMEALAYSERFYWQLLAAYFHLTDDPRRMKQALSGHYEGIARSDKNEICNPVIGKFPRTDASAPHFKSLFCTALGPVYRSKTFYRYAPSACMVLVYAQEFMEKKVHHPKTMHHISLDMVQSNLKEIFGDELTITRDELASELPLWRTLIQHALQLERKAAATCSISCQFMLSSTTMTTFRHCAPTLVNSICLSHLPRLPVMQRIMWLKQVSPHQILNAHFAGTGLYVLPHYLN